MAEVLPLAKEQEEVETFMLRVRPKRHAASTVIAGCGYGGLKDYTLQLDASLEVGATVFCRSFQERCFRLYRHFAHSRFEYLGSVAEVLEGIRHV